MTWQFILILQILASSVMTIFARYLSLKSQKLFFSVAVFSYIAVACAGLIYSQLLDSDLSIPQREAWPFLFIQGLSIPAAWLVQYRLISRVGAGNTMIVTTLNVLLTAILGIIMLGEALTISMAIGACMVLGGVMIALLLKPDSSHAHEITFPVKLGLTALGAVLFAVGMYAEKIAVDYIGAGDYVAYGWFLQAFGALVLYVIFGRQESKHVTRKFIHKGFTLGILTSVAGGLYIYALSIGSLSQTIIATSGKIVIVMMLATLFLHERNALGYKAIAFLLTVCGVWLVLG